MTPQPEEYRTIPLTRGKCALVDAVDFDRINQHKWCVSVSGYAVRRAANLAPRTPGHIVFMHREVLGLAPEDPQKGDHRSLNRLDNRRSNLRFADTAQNVWNQPLRSDNTSGHKGVSLDKKSGTYTVYVRAKPNKRVSYPGFATAEDGAAFRAAILASFHGEFARQAGVVQVDPSLNVPRFHRIPVDRERVLRMRREGRTLLQIAAEMRVTKQRVWQIVAGKA